ncbi:sensor histidine kinase [Kitasatospora griseola]|uniref:sensor histidine kinase n=1 Tax=Kitasatospora griseola TaxID=2064 RepID=UPI00166FA8CE|nr:histidine kinase [Kitasatospora griseola]GGQ74633.1 histidine kinase [Kitasatospora griseola]
MSKKPAGDGLWWWARRRSAALDVALALAAATECAAGAYGLVRVRLDLGLAAAVVGVVLGTLAGLSLLVRRRWPVLPVVVALVFVPGFFGVVLLVVSLYTLAATWEWPSRRARVIVLSTVAAAETFGMVLLAMFAPNPSPPQEPLPPGWVLVIVSAFVAVGMAVAPVVTGLYMGARRRLVVSLRDRAEGLETELTLLAEQARERAWRARVEERTLIAREMHDVVAHRVSLMVVHAAAVERIIPKDPARARQSANLIGEVGRQALDELREILGVLRMTEAQDQVEAPVGGLGELPELVEQSRAAGMAVSLTVSGEHLVYVAEAEQTAFRVVQEGLTNAHKYAGGARVAVLLAYVPNGVRVSVTNDCPGGAAVPVALPSGGNGLVGMRERVLTLGGMFHAGPEDDGGFRVEAVLPSRLRLAVEPLN